MVHEPDRRPTLVLSPADDAQFCAVVERLFDDAPSKPDLLQALLRRQYPHAVVRPRELAGEQIEMWYVYRDGHWVRPAR